MSDEEECSIEIVFDEPEQPGPQPAHRDFSRGSSRISGLVLHWSATEYRPFDNDSRLPRPGTVGWQRAVEDGTYILPNGTAPDAALRARIVARLLGRCEPPVFDPSAPEAARRAYVPGLWNHDTTPALVGPKGWGKTWFLCPLAAALIIPGRRFLDFFEPAQMTDEERRRDVWLINSESPAGDVHEVLLTAGLRFGYRDGLPCYFGDEYGLDAGALIVDHLRERGGPTLFDLTDKATVDEWGTRLIEYGDREHPPLTVIADGVTAMVGNDTARYGLFSGRLKSMQRAAGISNGLGVLHSPMGPAVDTPMNGVESMAEWDGMWLASASTFPISSGTGRYLRITPRMLGPELTKRRIVLDSDGGLRIEESETPAEPALPPSNDTRAQVLIDTLKKAGKDWLWTRELCGSGDDYALNKAVLEQLERDGAVTSKKVQEGRTRGMKWTLSH